MDAKKQVLEMLEELDEDDLRTVASFAEFLALRRSGDFAQHRLPARRKPRRPTGEPPNDSEDPVLRALESAPFDDEPETPEEAEAVRKARAAVGRGEVVSNEELRQRIGW